jgi:hypothetical protein
MLVTLALGCATNPKSEIGNRKSEIAPPPLPRHATLAARTSTSEAAAVAPQLPRTITLLWDKNDLHADTVTEVWSAPTPAGPFTWLLDAPEPQVTLPVTNGAQFFIIRNRLYTEVSDWARNTP